MMLRRQRRSEPAQSGKPREALSNGRAAAAMLAAGIGSLVFGFLTILVQVSPAVRNALQFYQPAGQITGLTTLSVAAWLISWYILFRLWKEQQVPFSWVFAVTLLLIVLGLVGTFPPFYGLFG